MRARTRPRPSPLGRFGKAFFVSTPTLGHAFLHPRAPSTASEIVALIPRGQRCNHKDRAKDRRLHSQTASILRLPRGQGSKTRTVPAINKKPDGHPPPMTARGGLLLCYKCLQFQCLCVPSNGHGLTGDFAPAGEARNSACPRYHRADQISGHALEVAVCFTCSRKQYFVRSRRSAPRDRIGRGLHSAPPASLRSIPRRYSRETDPARSRPSAKLVDTDAVRAKLHRERLHPAY